MEIDANTNRASEALPDTLPAGAGALPAVRPKTGTGQHPSPTGAQAANGDWESVVPPVSYFTTLVQMIHHSNDPLIQMINHMTKQTDPFVMIPV